MRVSVRVRQGEEYESDGECAHVECEDSHQARRGGYESKTKNHARRITGMYKERREEQGYKMKAILQLCAIEFIF